MTEPATVTRNAAADNRAAARDAGESTFTGTPCRAARHDGTRYTSSGACVACMAARYRRARKGKSAARPAARKSDAATLAALGL